MDGAPRCALGEAVRWIDGAWWWLDIRAVDGPTGIYRWRPDRSPELFVTLPARVSAIGPAAGGLLINVDTMIARLAIGTGELDVVAELDVPRGHRLNDGIGDGAGGLYVGTVDRHHAPTGQLIHVTGDGKQRLVSDGFTMSNGLALSATGALFHADSGARTVWRHDPDGRRAVYVVNNGTPDGLCADPRGGFWVAVYGAGEVRRIVDGAVVATVRVPTPQTTSVGIGGPNADRMLITTGREGLAEGADELAGLVFQCRLREGLDVLGANPAGSQT